MLPAYDSLAEWFEYLNDDCDYLKWSQYFIDGLARLGAGREGTEIGCGSGYFCRRLAGVGYKMSGVDLSAPMLVKAQTLAREEGLNIPFIQMDAVRLKTMGKQDFLLSPNDCYNYIPGEKLPEAFKRAAACLKKGGIFWFDLSSEKKLREKVADTVCADDRDEVTYLAFNHLFEDRVEMEVTLFVREKEGKYTRFDETHVQYIHREEEVVSRLKEAGFEVLAVEGHLGEEKENSDRLNYICRKK